MLFVFHLDKTFLMKEKLVEYTKALPLLLYKVSTWNKSEGSEAAVKTPVSPFPVLIVRQVAAWPQTWTDKRKRQK